MIKRTKGYALSFFLVLAAGLIGALITFQAAPRPDFAQVTLPDAEGALLLISTVMAASAPVARPLAPATPEPTQPVAPTAIAALAMAPATPIALIPTAAPTQPAAPAEGGVAADTPAPAPLPPTEQPSPLPTEPAAVPTAPPIQAYEFAPAAAVRHSNENCPGQSIRGIVYDSAGNPLPGIRLWLYDQWANSAYTESKAGEADRGQYDFPVYQNDPAIFYVTVLTSDGSPISPTVEVYHRQGPQQAIDCHWVDWKRTQ